MLFSDKSLLFNVIYYYYLLWDKLAFIHKKTKNSIVEVNLNVMKIIKINLFHNNIYLYKGQTI